MCPEEEDFLTRRARVFLVLLGTEGPDVLPLRFSGWESKKDCSFAFGAESDLRVQGKAFLNVPLT